MANTSFHLSVPENYFPDEAERASDCQNPANILLSINIAELIKLSYFELPSYVSILPKAAAQIILTI